MKHETKIHWNKLESCLLWCGTKILDKLDKEYKKSYTKKEALDLFEKYLDNEFKRSK